MLRRNASCLVYTGQTEVTSGFRPRQVRLATAAGWRIVYLTCVADQIDFDFLQRPLVSDSNY